MQKSRACAQSHSLTFLKLGRYVDAKLNFAYFGGHLDFQNGVWLYISCTLIRAPSTVHRMIELAIDPLPKIRFKRVVL